MGPGTGTSGDERTAATGWVGETLLAAVVFAVVMGVTLASHGRGEGGSEVLVGSPGDRSAEPEGDAASTQPSSGGSGDRDGVEGAVTGTTLVIDPETGETVAVTIPPGTTVVDGEVVPDGEPGAPGGTPGAPPGGSPTTSPPTTGSPATTTTEPPPDTTTTSSVPDTSTSSTTETTTTTTTLPA